MTPVDNSDALGETFLGPSFKVAIAQLARSLLAVLQIKPPALPEVNDWTRNGSIAGEICVPIALLARQRLAH
jgi:hypothetical protein